MTFKSSLLFAKSLIFPKSDKNSSARRSLFGALFCIGLSIVPLVVVISITNGMISGMTERIIGLSSNHLNAYVASSIRQVKSAQAFRDYANEFYDVEGVLAVYPEVGISALAAGKDFRTGVQLRAVDTDVFEKNHYFKELFTVVDGDLQDFINTSERKAVIGKKMSETLKLKPGDTFRIITTKNINGKISPKLTSFKVSAIITSGYQELDEFWIFIPLDTAYSSLSLSSATYNVMIETPDPLATDLVRIQNDLAVKLGRYVNLYRWDQVNAAEFENFSSTKVMLVFIMMMIVLVASINIASAIVMLVMERKKEIAILKSIGASPSGITISFIIAGMSCGLGGLLIGIPVGLLLAVNANQLVMMMEKLVNHFAKIAYIFKGIPLEEVQQIHLMDPAYYLQNIPIDIPFSQIFLIALSTIILSFLVALIPSIKAGKEKPLDILRKS